MSVAPMMGMMVLSLSLWLTVAEQLDRRPGGGMGEPGVGRADEVGLGRPEGARRLLSGVKVFVETQEKRGGDVVLDLPQSADYAPRAGRQEGAGEAGHAGYMQRVAAKRAAGGEDDERAAL